MYFPLWKPHSWGKRSAAQPKTIEPEFPPNKKGLHMKLSAEDAFRLYGDRVFSAAFSVTGNQADADDAVQDTYLRYCSYDKEFTDEDHIRAWLLRVAINRARDQKRSFWEKHRVSWEDYMETLFVTESRELLFTGTEDIDVRPLHSPALHYEGDSREAALRAAKAAGFQVVLVGPGHPAEASALADVTVSDYRDMIRVER